MNVVKSKVFCKLNNNHLNFSNFLLLSPSNHDHTPKSDQSANADTGTTGNYMCEADINMLVDILPVANGIRVKMPDGSFISSTHTARLNLPMLSEAARVAHIFPTLDGSLLSIGMFTDSGLIAVYDSEKVDICTRNGDVVLSGQRSPVTRLWMIALDHRQHAPAVTIGGSQQLATPASGVSPSCKSIDARALKQSSGHGPVISLLLGTESAAATSVLAPRALEQIVATYHAMFNWPAVNTFLAAIDRGYITVPGLTAAMVRKYPPNPTATAKGHLDQLRQGLHSTKHLMDEETDDDWHPSRLVPTVSHVSQRRRATVQTRIYKPHPPSRRNHSDLAGRFPVTSLHGNQYMMIMYCEDANYIHVEVMRERKAADFLKAYKSGVEERRPPPVRAPRQ